MAESWLYPITLQTIQQQHALSLTPLMDFRARIALPIAAPAGTPMIQIDVVAADTANRTLVLAECKDFLTFQGVSMCAEQLILNTFLLKNYLADRLGGRQHHIELAALDGYRLIRYVSLGGHQGTRYGNARTQSDAESCQRLNSYRAYLNMIGRRGIGILLFRSPGAAPVVEPAVPCDWYEAKQHDNSG